jgi:hypothetical protein
MGFYLHLREKSGFVFRVFRGQEKNRGNIYPQTCQAKGMTCLFWVDWVCRQWDTPTMPTTAKDAAEWKIGGNMRSDSN